MPNDLLDAETIAQAEAMGLHARQVVEGYLSGEHKSPFRGFSVEFTQHREYVPGDDVRHLDWKVLGRTDRQYVKQYEQETNYVAHLLIDASASMAYGSGAVSKIHYARQLAACLAYLVLYQRDAVSMNVFDSGAIRRHVPRTGNLASIHNILTALAAVEPAARTDAAAVLHRIASTVPRRGIVILISDLFDDEGAMLDGIRHLRFRGHETIVFHVLDPCEIEFPFQGLVEFEGLEEPSKLTTRPGEIRRSYLAEMNTFRARVREGCERHRSDYVLAETGKPMHEMLAGYLAFRARTGVR